MSRPTRSVVPFRHETHIGTPTPRSRTVTVRPSVPMTLTPRGIRVRAWLIASVVTPVCYGLLAYADSLPGTP